MQPILTRQFFGGKYSKWIFILQEFDLEFESAKSNKPLVFSELICDLPSTKIENVVEDSLPDECLFLISSDDYGMDILSRLKIFGPTFLVRIVVKYDIKLIILSSSVILFTSVVLTPFFDDALPTMKLRKL
jgi:hypothetical protein